MILENIISINVFFIEYTVRRPGMLLLSDKGVGLLSKMIIHTFKGALYKTEHLSS